MLRVCREFDSGPISDHSLKTGVISAFVFFIIRSLFSSSACPSPWQGRNLACLGSSLQWGSLSNLLPRCTGLGSESCWQVVLHYFLHVGCPSVQQCSVEIVSRFLLSSILVEVVSLVTTLASDTTVKVFEQIW